MIMFICINYALRAWLYSFAWYRCPARQFNYIYMHSKQWLTHAHHVVLVVSMSFPPIVNSTTNRAHHVVLVVSMSFPPIVYGLAQERCIVYRPCGEHLLCLSSFGCVQTRHTTPHVFPRSPPVCVHSYDTTPREFSLTPQRKLAHAKLVIHHVRTQ